MQQILSSNYFKKNVYLTVAMVLLTLVPFSPVAVIGGLALITILPGAQLVRWLGFYQPRWDFKTVSLSVTLGMVTSPILIYWSSLLFGFNRWLLPGRFRRTQRSNPKRVLPPLNRIGEVAVSRVALRLAGATSHRGG